MFGFQKKLISLVILIGCGQKSVTPTSDGVKTTSTESPTVEQTADSTTPEEKQDAPEKANLIQKSWTGRILLPRYIQKPDSPPANNQLIIRNETDFTKFVERIPKKTIQKTNPAPKTNDPFVNGLQIDFQTSMLLVSIRDENMYSIAPIVSVYQKDEKITANIQVKNDPESAMMASMSGIGTYSAVQIALTEKEIIFNIEKEESK